MISNQVFESISHYIEEHQYVDMRTLNSNIELFKEKVKHLFSVIEIELIIGGESQTAFGIDDDIEFHISLYLQEGCDDEVVTYKIKSNKPNDDCLYIISPKDFTSNLSKELITTQANFWVVNVLRNHKKVTLENTSHYLIEPSLDNSQMVLKRSNRMNSLGLSSDDIDISKLNSLIDLLGYNPFVLEYFTLLRSKLCLSLLSREYNNNTQTVYFDSSRSLDLTIVETQRLISASNYIYDVYNWTYSDDRVPARVGIINQLLSQTLSILDSFDRNIVNLLNSAFQVYIKEDFESFLEIRNRVGDATFDLCNRIQETIESRDSSLKQTLFVSVSYFFSIFVFTAIDKGKLVNLFTFELTLLSTFFLLVASLNVYFSHRASQKSVEITSERLKEEEERALIFLGERESRQYFQSNSIIKTKEKASSISLLVTSYAVLFLMCAVIWFLYTKNSNFISVPVYLHII